MASRLCVWHGGQQLLQLDPRHAKAAPEAQYRQAFGSAGGQVSPRQFIGQASSDAEESGCLLHTESVPERRLVPTQRFLVLFPPAPSVVVDGRNVSVGFHDARLGDPDVWVWTSTDRGSRWRPARRVNGGQAPDGRSQYLPQLAIAPNGRLDVVYYDRGSDPDDVANHLSFQSSTDGTKFSSPTRVSERSFDSRVGFGHERGMPELGNRLGLLATDDGALAVWADTRTAIGRTIKQDLVRGLVSVSEADPWRRPLRSGGGAAVVVGTALRSPR